MAPDLLVDIEKRFASGFVVRARLRAPMPLGSILVLFGPSGSGKTTIIRCIAGLETPETGLVQYGGETWFAAVPRTFVPPQRRRIGYVFQDAALFPHLTARANVEYGAGTDPPGGAVRSSELIDLLDLGAIADRYPRQLSGGQSQRVALARALAPHPRLLLLDEPFAALDTPARSALRRLLRATVTRLGIAAVLVTHDRNEAIAIGDGIAVIIEGRVRQMGPVVDVFRRPADLTVARSVGVDSVLPASIESAAEGLLELRVEGARLRAADVGLEADTRDVFACIRAEDVTIERATPVGASARNHLAGTIESIESDGPLERVTIDCGFPLTALITRHACDEMALRPGSPVVAAIKATAIHLVPRV